MIFEYAIEDENSWDKHRWVKRNGKSHDGVVRQYIEEFCDENPDAVCEIVMWVRLGKAKAKRFSLVFEKEQASYYLHKNVKAN